MIFFSDLAKDLQYNSLFSTSKHIPLGQFACANLYFNNIKCGQCHIEKIINKYFLQLQVLIIYVGFNHKYERPFRNLEKSIFQ